MATDTTDGATIERAGDGARIPLSVLDQAPVGEGSTGSAALRETIDLARLADRLGYHRCWVAEHHGTPALACTSPEALIGPIAAATERLRVGSGGVMLPHYSPFKVAETFSMLSALYPGRIDLGLGRAAGTDPGTAHALQRDRARRMPDDFPQQLAELLGYLDDSLPDDFPFARLARVLPGGAERPAPWLLGSSPQSGIWAAELGLPYAFADFIASGSGAAIAARYRADFRAGALDAPRVIVAAWALCADTAAEAHRLASSARMMLALLHTGQLIPVPSVETAERFLADLERRPAGGQPLPTMARERRTIVGDPPTVRAGLAALAAEYGADEVMVVTITHDPAARRRSYELIAG